jgi:hypothetical protein
MYVIYLWLVLSLSLPTATSLEIFDLPGPSYDDLPSEAVFPGPWNDNIQAPANKSYIQPASIWHSEGDTNWKGGNLTMGAGGLMTLEFPQNIAGRCVEHPVKLEYLYNFALVYASMCLMRRTTHLLR